MQFIIKCIGIAIIVQACVFLLRIDLLRGMLRFFSRGNRMYLLGSVRITLAIILFVGATHCRRLWLIIALALILLLSGIAIFTLKPAAFNKILTWHQQRTDLFLRLMAGVMAAIGVLVIYAV